MTLLCFRTLLKKHEARLIHVLGLLKEYGLKLSPDKCKFFQTSVRYLGHIVSSDGVKTDPEKVQEMRQQSTNTPPGIVDVDGCSRRPYFSVLTELTYIQPSSSTFCFAGSTSCSLPLCLTKPSSPLVACFLLICSVRRT